MFTEEQKSLSQTVTVEQPTSFLTEQEIGDLSWMSVEYADEESGMTPGGLHIAVVSHTQVMDDLRTGIGFEDGSRIEVEDGSSHIFEDVSRDGFSLEYPSLLQVYSE